MELGVELELGNFLNFSKLTLILSLVYLQGVAWAFKCKSPFFGDTLYCIRQLTRAASPWCYSVPITIGTFQYLGLPALITRRYLWAASPQYKCIHRAAGPQYYSVPRACSTGYISVPRAASPWYIGLADYRLGKCNSAIPFHQFPKAIYAVVLV